MKLSTIKKIVADTNAANLAYYESNVKVIAQNIQAARAEITRLEADFTKNVAYQATNIARQQDALNKLTPPTEVTADEIFGKETVAAATE